MFCGVGRWLQAVLCARAGQVVRHHEVDSLLHIVHAVRVIVVVDDFQYAWWYDVAVQFLWAVCVDNVACDIENCQAQPELDEEALRLSDGNSQILVEIIDLHFIAQALVRQLFLCESSIATLLPEPVVAVLKYDVH